MTVNLSIGRNTLWFFTEFQITWIWKWDIIFSYDSLKIPVLQRTFHYKWWEKFEIDSTIKQAINVVAEYVKVFEEAKSQPAQPDIQNVFTYMMDITQKKFPTLTPLECQLKVFVLLKDQFEASQPYQPEQIPSSSSSTPGSSFAILAGESQEPEETPATLNVTVGDYMDAIVEFTQDRVNQQKDKNKMEI